MAVYEISNNQKMRAQNRIEKFLCWTLTIQSKVSSFSIAESDCNTTKTLDFNQRPTEHWLLSVI